MSSRGSFAPIPTSFYPSEDEQDTGPATPQESALDQRERKDKRLMVVGKNQPKRSPSDKEKKLLNEVLDAFGDTATQHPKQNLEELTEARDTPKGEKLPEDFNGFDKPRQETLTKPEEKQQERTPMDGQKTVSDDFDAVCAVIEQWPREQQLALIAKFQDKAETKPTKAKNDQPPQPEISHIPIWQGKKKDGPSIEYLQHYYGTFDELKARGLYREVIRDHDPRLVQRVSEDASRMGLKGREFIPTISDKVDKRAERLGITGADKAKTEDIGKTVGTLKTRTYRKQSLQGNTHTPRQQDTAQPVTDLG